LDLLRFQPIQFPLLLRLLRVHLGSFPGNFLHLVSITGDLAGIETLQNLESEPAENSSSLFASKSAYEVRWVAEGRGLEPATLAGTADSAERRAGA